VRPLTWLKKRLITFFNAHAGLDVLAMRAQLAAMYKQLVFANLEAIARGSSGANAWIEEQATSTLVLNLPIPL
jgi:hypothetical protein